MKLHPQYLIDSKGKSISVVLPIKEYEALIEYIAAEDAMEYVGKRRKINQDQITIAKNRLKAYKKDQSRGIPWEKAKKRAGQKIL